MFQNAKDIANAALRLIELAEAPEIAQNKELASTIELAAAIMATHVQDWHYLNRGLKSELTDKDRHDFKSAYLTFDTLRLIANGTKHPVAKYPDISSAASREPEWEDDEFWNSVPGTSQLFVEVNGKQRGVRALTWGFCKQFLSHSEQGTLKARPSN